MDLVQLQKLIKQIEKEREVVKQILSWKEIKNTFSIDIKTVLMIVESPNKARTIANFFGNPSKRLFSQLSVYEVSLPDKLLLISSSWGHVVDLIKKKYLRGVEEKEKWFVPVYDSIKQCFDNHLQILQVVDDIERCNWLTVDKRDFITSLQRVALEVDEVYIATDPDTEWEKIAYDIWCLIAPFNPHLYRIEYHEVTKKAILQAIKEKRFIDENWVKAQIVRRIADRRVGFWLSRILQTTFKWKNYSAGRVQTPVLGWVIERDKQTKEKKALIYINIEKLKGEKVNQKWIVLKSELSFEEEDVKKIEFLNKKEKIKFKILNISEKPINPLPPFSTDILLEEANKKYKFSVDYTMQLAQYLFENWLITYHRTDSTHISNFWKTIAKQYLYDNWLSEYFKPRSWWTESTHEWIRPTKPNDMQEIKRMLYMDLLNIKLSNDHLKLYDLIFRRFIASQMKEVKVKQANIQVDFVEKNYQKQNSFYIDIVENWWNLIIPIEIYPLKSVEGIFDIKIKLIPKVLPYTQGELIMEMKTKGLWRPSTYATIISTLLKRKYIIQLPKTWWLKHTKKGEIIYNFLIEKYLDLVNEEFTRLLEEKMDKIQHGTDWQQVLLMLYEQLKKEKVLIDVINV